MSSENGASKTDLGDTSSNSHHSSLNKKKTVESNANHEEKSSSSSSSSSSSPSSSKPVRAPFQPSSDSNVKTTPVSSSSKYSFQIPPLVFPLNNSPSYSPSVKPAALKEKTAAAKPIGKQAPSTLASHHLKSGENPFFSLLSLSYSGSFGLQNGDKQNTSFSSHGSGLGASNVPLSELPPVPSSVSTKMEKVDEWEHRVFSSYPDDIGEACFHTGMDIKQNDVSRMRKWLELACEAGTPGSDKAKPFLAALSLSDISYMEVVCLKRHKIDIIPACLENAHNAASKSWDRTKYWFSLASQKGDPKAVNILGNMNIFDGMKGREVVGKMEPLAMKILLTPGEIGTHLCHIGLHYRDKSSCLKWLRLAGESGHNGAKLLAEKIDQAKEWGAVVANLFRQTERFRKGPAMGEVLFQCALDRTCSSEQRVQWLKEAVKSGSTIARELTEVLEKMITSFPFIYDKIDEILRFIPFHGRDASVFDFEGDACLKNGLHIYDSVSRCKRWLQYTVSLKKKESVKAQEALSFISLVEKKMGEFQVEEYKHLMPFFSPGSAAGNIVPMCTQEIVKSTERGKLWLGLAGELSPEFENHLPTICNVEEKMGELTLANFCIFVRHLPGSDVSRPRNFRETDIGSAFELIASKERGEEEAHKWYKAGSEVNTPGGERCKIIYIGKKYLNGSEYYRDEAMTIASQIEILSDLSSGSTAERTNTRCRRFYLRVLLSGSLRKNQDSALHRSFFRSSMREIHLLPLLAKYLIEEKKNVVVQSRQEVRDTWNMYSLIFSDTSQLTSLSLQDQPKPSSAFLSSSLCPSLKRLKLSFSCDLSPLSGAVFSSTLNSLEILYCKTLSLSPLSTCHFPSLETLIIHDCKGFTSLEGLTKTNTSALKVLTIEDCPVLEDISALSECGFTSPSLTRVSFRCCMKLADISPLLSLSECLSQLVGPLALPSQIRSHPGVKKLKAQGVRLIFPTSSHVW